MTTPTFGANNAFGATSTAQPAAGSLFGANAFNKAPTTSLFSQPANQQAGLYNFYLVIHFLAHLKIKCIVHRCIQQRCKTRRVIWARNTRNWSFWIFY